MNLEEIDFDAIANEFDMALAKHNEEYFSRVKPEPIIQETEPAHFPVDHLPMVIGQAIEDAHSLTNAHKAICAATLLSQAALAAQEHFKVRPFKNMPDACFSLGLYFLTIGTSGAGKSRTNALLGKALINKQSVLNDEYRDAVREYKTAHQIWKSKRQGIIKKIESKTTKLDDLKRLENDLFTHDLSEPFVRRVPSYKYGQITPEKLLQVLSERHPSAIIDTAEGGQFFGSHAMKSDSQLSFISILNSLFSGEGIDNDTIGNGRRSVRDAVLSANIMIQPKTLREALSKVSVWDDIGLGSRFFLADSSHYDAPRYISLEKKHEITPAITEYENAIERLFNRPTNLNDNGGCSWEILNYSNEAAIILKDWNNNNEDRRIKGDLKRDGMEGYTRRGMEQVARLSGVIHCLISNPVKQDIQPVSVNAAIALAEYYLSEQLRYRDMVIPNQTEQDALDIESSLLRREEIKKDGCIPRGTIQKNKWRGKADRFNKALKLLGDLGRIQLVGSGETMEVGDGETLIRVHPALIR